MAIFTDGYKLICRELFASLITQFDPIDVYKELVPDASQWDEYGGFDGDFIAYLYSNKSKMSVRLHDEWVIKLPNFCEERGVPWGEFYHNHIERLWWGLIPVPKLFQTFFLKYPSLFPTLFKGTSRGAILKVVAKSIKYFSPSKCYANILKYQEGEYSHNLFIYKEESSEFRTIIPYGLWIEPIIRNSGRSGGMPLPVRSQMICETKQPLDCIEGLEKDGSGLFMRGECIARLISADSFFTHQDIKLPKEMKGTMGYLFDEKYQVGTNISGSFEADVLYGAEQNVIHIVDSEDTDKIVTVSNFSDSIDHSVPDVIRDEDAFLDRLNKQLSVLKSSLLPALTVRFVSRDKVFLSKKLVEGKEANILYYLFIHLGSGNHTISNAEMRHDIPGFGETRDNFTKFFNGVKDKLHKMNIPVDRIKNGVHTITLPSDLTIESE